MLFVALVQKKERDKVAFIVFKDVKPCRQASVRLGELQTRFKRLEDDEGEPSVVSCVSASVGLRAAARGLGCVCVYVLQGISVAGIISQEMVNHVAAFILIFWRVLYSSLYICSAVAYK